MTDQASTTVPPAPATRSSPPGAAVVPQPRPQNGRVAGGFASKHGTGDPMTEPNFRNRIFYHGDNLHLLRSMNSCALKLIATDPSLEKGRNFRPTPGSLAAGVRFEDRWSWDRDVRPDCVDAVKDERPASWADIEMARGAYGPAMAAYLLWPSVRLGKMHRVLHDDGSLYLNLDHVLLCGPCNIAKSNTPSLNGVPASSARTAW